MGLYELELTKQIHLRNRQKREWEMLNKKRVQEEQLQLQKNNDEQIHLHQEEKNEERIEMEETKVSKNLASAMVRSSLGDQAETLQRVVEVLQNQNGTA